MFWAMWLIISRALGGFWIWVCVLMLKINTYFFIWWAHVALVLIIIVCGGFILLKIRSLCNRIRCIFVIIFPSRFNVLIGILFNRSFFSISWRFILKVLLVFILHHNLKIGFFDGQIMIIDRLIKGILELFFHHLKHFVNLKYFVLIVWAGLDLHFADLI
jgi:hypothetical protein